jgi:orotate phosphoribosyltransferase
MPRRKKIIMDARAMQEELDVIDARIKELQQKRAQLKKEAEDAEKAEIIKVVMGAGLTASTLSAMIEDYFGETGETSKRDAPEPNAAVREESENEGASALNEGEKENGNEED